MTLKNDFYNYILCKVVKKTYLHGSTIYAFMQRIDRQATNKQIETYIAEYKKWKAKKVIR